MATEKPGESELNQGIVWRCVCEPAKPGLPPISPSDLRLATVQMCSLPPHTVLWPHRSVSSYISLQHTLRYNMLRCWFNTCEAIAGSSVLREGIAWRPEKRFCTSWCHSERPLPRCSVQAGLLLFGRRELQPAFVIPCLIDCSFIWIVFCFFKWLLKKIFFFNLWFKLEICHTLPRQGGHIWHSVTHTCTILYVSYTYFYLNSYEWLTFS